MKTLKELLEPMEEEWDEALPEEEELVEALPLEEAEVAPKAVRPEWIMAGIALVCAALLGAAIIFSLPHMTASEDPEEVLDREHPPQIVETLPQEETVPETEPVNPTIPPAPNPYDRYDFQYNRHNYLLLQNLPSSPGIDVSAHQQDIDWEAVKRSGIEFAIIRLGYRGYGKAGKLNEDAYAQRNLRGAREAGLKVGAYFFSQALNIKETDEEIEYMLNILGDYELDMPIILDWEIPTADARTVHMDARTLTDIQLHFCSVMEEKGYQPMIYFNQHQSENLYYLSELEDYPFWLAQYKDRMTYPWQVEMWQYTSTGRVPGIKGDVDINVYMPD